MKAGLVAVGASLAVHAVVVGVIAARPVEEKVVAPLAAREAVEFSVTSAAPARNALSPPGGKALGGSRGGGRGRPAARAAPAAPASPVAEPELPGPEADLAALDSAREERGALGGEERGEPGAEGDSAALDSAREERGALGGEERGGGSGPDVNALVHARLAAAAERCYPAAARRFQQRGTVQLSFCADANGAATDTAVTQGSGAPLLDGAAQGCVLAAAAPFPPEAAGRCFSVPVRFGVH